MKSFKINEEAQIVCEWKKTATAFKHEARLLINGREVEKTKIHYLNRTWESYEFESVIEKLIDNTDHLNEEEKKAFLKDARQKAGVEASQMFGTIGAIAKMGEIIHAGSKKAQNDWKARMLKAGLESKGLIMPEDWHKLSEDEKEKRLNNVIAELKTA